MMPLRNNAKVFSIFSIAGDGEVGNAFHHAFVNCIFTVRCGAGMAEQFWNRHENGTGSNQCFHAQMDQHKNKVGRGVGQGLGGGTTANDCITGVTEALWAVLVAGLFMAATGLSRPAKAQLDETCVVTTLNRQAPVDAGGAWVLPNVPTNQGPVRVRATCVDNGVTRSGQSEFIQIPANNVIRVPEIVFGASASCCCSRVVRVQNPALFGVSAFVLTKD